MRSLLLQDRLHAGRSWLPQASFDARPGAHAELRPPARGPLSPSRFTLLRRHPATSTLALLATSATLAGAALVPATSGADVASERARAAQLKAAVSAESAKIASTQAGLADAQARLAALQARVDRRKAQTDAAQTKLVRARIRLTRLERRNAEAKVTLSKNLLANYQSAKPDVVTVVLDSHGFADLLERVDFYDRVAKRNATILDDVRTTRIAVGKQTVQLKALRLRLQRLTAGAVEDRDEADVIREALLRREQAQLARRAGSRSQLRRAGALRGDVGATGGGDGGGSHEGRRRGEQGERGRGGAAAQELRARRGRRPAERADGPAGHAGSGRRS